ncbi:MAG: RNA-binding domain-containing protein [Promethearchaeota archaeon]
MNRLNNSRNKSGNYCISIQNIAFSVNSHATEDPNKVKKCLKTLLPEDFNSKKITIKNLDGEYNNSIKNLKLIIKQKKYIEFIFKNISKSLTLDEKKKLYREFNIRISKKSTFYLRLEKAPLAKGCIVLNDHSDVVKISISFYNSKTGRKKGIDQNILKQYLFMKKFIIEI